MAVPLGGEVDVRRADVVVRVQVQQHAFQPQDPAPRRDVQLRERVDAAHAAHHRLQLLRRHQVALVHHDDVGVRDLQVRRRRVPAPSRDVRRGVAAVRCGVCAFQRAQQVLGVYQRDDAVEVDDAAEALVDPEERGNVARVREPRRLEQDVVEGAAALDEGLEGGDAAVSALLVRRQPVREWMGGWRWGRGIARAECGKAGLLDGAADAAVGELKPLLDLLAVLRDGEGPFDVGGCWGRLVVSEGLCGIWCLVLRSLLFHRDEASAHSHQILRQVSSCNLERWEARGRGYTSHSV